MSAPFRTTSPNRRSLKIVATVVAAIVMLVVVNLSRSDSQDSATSLATQSVLGLPLQADETPPAGVPTTPPLSVPAATGTPVPFPTSAPTPTAVPTPIPTATPQPTAAPTPEPTPEPAATAQVAAATANTAAAEETAPAEEPTDPPATAVPEPTATAMVEPTATAVAEPTATVVPEATPTVEAFDIVEPTIEATVEPTPTPTAVPLQTAADLEAYVLGEINAVRANAGLGPIALDPAISSISRDWSQQMATGGFFEHRPSDQINAMLPAGWRQWGENIASAPDIFYAQDSLEASPGHYANMVGPFTHVGIGVFSNGSQVWVTQNFARY